VAADEAAAQQRELRPGQHIQVGARVVVDDDVGRGAPPLPVRAAADDLAAAVDALLGNVFAHTSDGTAMAVAVRPRPGGGAVVTVRDDGPGMPAEAVERGRCGGGRGRTLRITSSERGTEVVLKPGPPPAG
jgi:signal transduction histidine kinase